jgi:Cdc6-like AAA superfamily ATPase
MAQEGLRASLDEVTEKVDEIEIPDMDDYISESDLDDRIETYLNDNEYVTSSYVTDEIESNVSDKVESAVEELDISDKVKEVVEEMDKASFGDTEELKAIVIKVLKTLKFKVE